MKQCPNCNKTYDDSWAVCLQCNEKLVIGDASVHSRLDQIDARLIKVERSLGIQSMANDKQAVVIPVIKKLEPVPSVVKPAQKAGNKRDIESTIGLVWLNRIGVIALLFGVAFFLKYAFDNRWIGELGRVLLGLAGGFGLLVASEVSRRKKYDVMSQGLHGAGIGILYLSIYASFGFYHLIGLAPALAFMSLVTLYCGFWSIRTNWLSSAILGIAGGFLTPVLFSTANLDPYILFSYVALLDLGVLYISLYKKWRYLNLLSFAATSLLFNTWYASSNAAQDWMTALTFATVFFVIFCFLSISHNLMRKEKSDGVDVCLVLFNGVAYFSEVFRILKPFADDLPGLLPIGLACVYIVFSYSALKRCREDKGLILSYLGLAALFVTIAIPIQFKKNWITISWAMEALILCWIGMRIKHAYIRKMGLAVGILSLFRLITVDYPYAVYGYGNSNFTFIFNDRMFTYSVIVAALFAAGWLYKRYKNEVDANEKMLSTVLIVLANIVLLVQLSAESQGYFSHTAYLEATAAGYAENSYEFNTAYSKAYQNLFSAGQLSLSVLWIAYALGTIVVGIYRKFRALRIMSLVLFGMAVLKIFLFDLSQLDRIYRIISFIGLGIVLMMVSFFYQKYKDRLRDFALKD